MEAEKEKTCQTCPRCGKTIIDSKRYPKRFCSTLCQTRFNATKSYNKNKDTSEYKAKRKAYFDMWRKKNREHFNSLLREPNRIHQHKIREERIKKWVCLSCGRPRDDNCLHCSKCRIRMKNWEIRRVEKANSSNEKEKPNSSSSVITLKLINGNTINI